MTAQLFVAQALAVLALHDRGNSLAEHLVGGARDDHVVHVLMSRDCDFDLFSVDESAARFEAGVLTPEVLYCSTLGDPAEVMTQHPAHAVLLEEYIWSDVTGCEEANWNSSRAGNSSDAPRARSDGFKVLVQYRGRRVHDKARWLGSLLHGVCSCGSDPASLSSGLG